MKIKFNCTRTRTVASVTTGLSKMVDDLKAVYNEQRDAVDRSNAAIEEAKVSRDAAIEEGEAALRAASKIESLLA